MRIIHLAATPYWSGPLDNLARLALAQREAGHDVRVFVDGKRHHAPTEELAQPRLEEWGLRGSSQLELSVKSSPWSMLKDLRGLGKLDADVVHTHMSHDHFLARWAPSRRYRLVRSVHAARSLRPSLPEADAYTVPYREALLTLGKVRALVFPAIRPAEFVPAPDRKKLRAELGIEGTPVIGMISTFQPSRRHLVGLQAFRQVLAAQTQARLLLVGDGPLEPQLRSEAAGFGDRVLFPGYKSGPDFLRWLQALDEVWILGLGNDWSARAAVQARACDVRVVGVREGALVDWADTLCEPSPDSVANASASRLRVTRELPTAQEVAAQVLELYEQAGKEA